MQVWGYICLLSAVRGNYYLKFSSFCLCEEQLTSMPWFSTVSANVRRQSGEDQSEFELLPELGFVSLKTEVVNQKPDSRSFFWLLLQAVFKESGSLFHYNAESSTGPPNHTVSNSPFYIREKVFLWGGNERVPTFQTVRVQCAPPVESPQKASAKASG